MKPFAEKTDAGRHPVATRVTRGLSAVVLIALVGVSAYLGYAVTAQNARISSLNRRLSELSADHDLLAATVAATESTATAALATATPEPETATGPTALPGTRQMFGRVRSVSRQPYGWKLTFDPAQYMTGPEAFALASTEGKLTNTDGSYITDPSTRTVEFRLLKATPARVWSRAKGPRNAETTISAGEFAGVFPGGSAPNGTWMNSWFWLDVRDDVVLRVSQQRVD